MKVTIKTLFAICALVISGCTTPVALDPQSEYQQTAEYRAGYLYAEVDASIGDIFKAAILEMDQIGYLRTGELHKDTSITIYARNTGDDKITVQAKQSVEGMSEIRIRVGTLGNLAESQVIFARISAAL